MSKVHILPNLRKGLPNYIEEGFKDKNGLRAGFDVKARLQGHKAGSAGSDLSELDWDGTLDHPFYLAGPVDVKGISPEAVRQVVPADKSQGFSYDHLPFIEFFEEDFPWRYTPQRSSDKLVPWLMLLACKDDEFTLTSDAQGNKRVEIHVEGLSEFSLNSFYPDANWFFQKAHVQITTPGDEDPVEYVKDHPDDGFSRLFCMRLLEENTKYTVFLVPAFELGRLAGLGEPFSGSVGLTTLSFAGKPRSIVFPVYYQWSFTTGNASFMTYAKKQEFISETEFKALSPGLRADISETGLRHYREITTPLVNDEEPIDIPVALVKKGFSEKDLASEDPRMDDELKELLKLSPVFSDDVSGPSLQEDPWVVPPVYGARHVLAKPDELSQDQKHPFLKDLNLKFRNRAVAGMGANVVKKNQEMFMNRAWGMVEDVNRLNQRIREFYEAAKTNGAADAKISPLRKYEFRQHVSGMQADAAIRVAHAQSAAQVNALDMATDVTGRNLQVMMSTMGDYERASGIYLDQLKSLAEVSTWDSEPLIKRTELYQILAGQTDFFARIPAKYAFLKNLVDVQYPTISFVPGGGSSSKVAKISAPGGAEVFGFKIKPTKLHSWDSYPSYLGVKDSCLILQWLNDPALFNYNGIHLKDAYTIQTLVKTLEGSKQSFDSGWNGPVDMQGTDYDSWFLPIYSRFIRDTAHGTREDRVLVMRQPYYDACFKGMNPSTIMIPGHQGERLYIVSQNSLSDPSWQGTLLRNYPCADGRNIGSVELIGLGNDYFLPAGNHTLKKWKWVEKGVQINDAFNTLLSGARATFLKLLVDNAPVAKGIVRITRMKVGKSYLFLRVFTLSATVKIRILKIHKTVSAQVCTQTKLVFRYQWTESGGYLDLFLEDYFQDGVSLRFSQSDDVFKRDGDKAIEVDMTKLYNYLKRAYDSLVWYDSIVWRPNALIAVEARNQESQYPAILRQWTELSPEKIAGLLDPQKRKEIETTHRVATEGDFLKTRGDFERALNSSYSFIAEQVKALANHPRLQSMLEAKTKAKAERENEMKKPEATTKQEAGVPLVDADEENRKRLVEVAKTFAARGMTLDLKESNFDGKYPVMAAPVFPDPTSFYLREISERFLLPSVDELKMNSISCFLSNPAFEEAFLAGMNTEMGRELLWREYPTDERGSYFRKFWDQDELPQDFGKGYFDVKYLHNWNGRLGENHEAGKGRMLVFVIKSELMGNYPDTSIRLAKAVTKDGGTVLESVLSPVMTGWLADDTFMAGFQPSNLPTTQGIYLSFWETDKSLRFYRVMSMNNPASDYLSSEFAVNRVDSGSVWGVEIRPDYLTL